LKSKEKDGNKNFFKIIPKDFIGQKRPPIHDGD